MGFTIIEMAVALFVIALLLGSLLVPLTTQVESRNYAETQRILEQAREALIGFAAANGRLPCPASATSNGAEHFFSPGGTAANGICHASVTFATAYVGFLPAVTLGFSPADSSGYALDAWGLTQNRIRYAVSNQTIGTTARALTTLNGMRSATMSSVSAATTLLYVCNSGTGVTASNCNTATALASSVPAVIWSLGPNAATGGTSTDEAENIDNDRIFVYRTKGGGTGGDFDDLVMWLPGSVLFNRMIGAGQLP
jgi:type II secretory pathway pseudopilin PulG